MKLSIYVLNRAIKNFLWLAHFLQGWGWCRSILGFLWNKCLLYFFFPGCLSSNHASQFSPPCLYLVFFLLFGFYVPFTPRREQKKHLVEVGKCLVLERGVCVLLHCFPPNQYVVGAPLYYILLLFTLAKVKIQCPNWILRIINVINWNPSYWTLTNVSRTPIPCQIKGKN